jgi:hypothetical protein
MLRKNLIIAGAILALGVQPGRAHINPDLREGKKVVSLVLIVPPEVKVTKSGMKGAEVLVEEARSVEQALPALTAKALEDKACQVSADPFTREALDNNSDLRYTVADIQSRFNALHEQLAKKSKDVEKGRFTMGEEVSKLNPSGSVDALIFIRGYGRISTGGKKAFSVLGGLSGVLASANSIDLNIAVVDATNGAVLYYDGSTAKTDFVNHPEKMSDAVGNALKKFNCGSAK